ncbi:MAG: alpha/beta hydrolase [Lachnospiraceae bacterium]|nr:alpha/beta hydrolase [Lachnospiraceae bacterium]
MRREDFYFDSRDGQDKIHAIRWIPDGEIKAILQVIHGMAEYVARYEGFAEYMTSKGILVTGEDHLGHGETIAANNGIPGYFCAHDPATVTLRDVHRLKKLTQETYPQVPYFIMGHSMGSFIVRNYAIRYGKGVQGVIAMGTGMMPNATVKMAKGMSNFLGIFQGDKHVSKFLEKMSFGSYLSRIPNAKTPVDWLSVNEENVKRYIADPLCGFTFTINGFKTLSEFLVRLTDPDAFEMIPKSLPVLFVAGAEDPVGGWGEQVKAVAKKYQDAGMQDITLKLYDGDRHEILNEDNKEQVSEDIYQWLSSKLDA